jgi:hypothetical protein
LLIATPSLRADPAAAAVIAGTPLPMLAVLKFLCDQGPKYRACSRKKKHVY